MMGSLPPPPPTHTHTTHTQCTGKRLPEWAFQQYEVVTDKAVEGSQTVWTMEDLQVARGNNETRDEEEAIKNEWISQKQASQSAEVTVSGSYSFLEKYLEIQVSKKKISCVKFINRLAASHVDGSWFPRRPCIWNAPSLLATNE